jgi:hypothetical protein
MEDNWTGREEERQDTVDNAIYNLMIELAPWETDEDDVEWDMEYIAEVREIIQNLLVDKLHLMTEYEFYPYRLVKTVSQPEGFVISDKYGKIIHRLEDSIGELDAQEYADLIGEIFGGTCRYQGDYKYLFIPNSDYQGGLDDLKED